MLRLTTNDQGSFHLVMKRKYRVLEDGAFVTEIDTGLLGNHFRFEWNGDTYGTRDKTLLFSKYVLQRNNVTLETPRAKRKLSLLSNRFAVHVGANTYALKTWGRVRRAGRLYFQKTPVGGILQASAFSRSFDIDLPDEFDVPTQLFIAWLVIASPGEGGD